METVENCPKPCCLLRLAAWINCGEPWGLIHRGVDRSSSGNIFGLRPLISCLPQMHRLHKFLSFLGEWGGRADESRRILTGVIHTIHRLWTTFLWTSENDTIPGFGVVGAKISTVCPQKGRCGPKVWKDNEYGCMNIHSRRDSARYSEGVRPMRRLNRRMKHTSFSYPHMAAISRMGISVERR